MKTRSLIPFILLTLVGALLIGSALGQGSTLQTIAWTGTTNDILALNVAHPLGATASSGLPVSLRVEAGPGVITDGTISVTGIGTVVVSADQAGDATFDPAHITRAFNVPQALLTRVAVYATGGYGTGGYAWGVHVVGNYAYVADYEAGLLVLDISNPASPVRVSTVDTSGFAYGVQVLGNLAFVANGSVGTDGGLEVLDVSNPASPVHVGGCTTSNGSAIGLEVMGNLAYVASVGLQVIDVKNPASLLQVGVYTNSAPYAVQVMGNYAYVADGDAGLLVLDVSDPAHPAWIGGVVTGGSARGVQVVGNYAYVASAGLQVIDVSNPADPMRVGQWNDQVWLGSSAFAEGLVVSGNHAFVAEGDTGLQVIDVSDPASPVRVGGHSSGGYARSVQVTGNYAYVADDRDGLQILELRLGYPQNLKWTSTTNESLALNLDHPLGATASSGLPVTFRVVSGPAVIENGAITATDKGTVVVTAEQAGDAAYLPVSEIRSFNVRRAVLMPVGGYLTSGAAKGVQVVGNNAYVAESGTWEGSRFVGAGLLVIDISDPALPTRVGGFTFDPPSNGEASGVQVVGNHAYVTASGRLRVIDVSNPATPVQVGGYTNDTAVGFQVVGNYAYAVGGGRFQVIDLSNPAKPAQVGGADTGRYDGNESGVQVVGNYAYVVGRSRDGGRFQVIDVRDPANPMQVGATDTRSGVNGVQVVGNRAYLAEGRLGRFGVGDNGLEVISLNGPASPLATGWVGADSDGGTSSGWADVQVVWNYAYLVASDGGLMVVDVSNPANPVPVGRYVAGDSAGGLQVVGNHVYVATGTGLQVLELKLGYPQALEWQLPAEVLFQSQPIVSPATTTGGLPFTMSVLDGPARIVNNQLVLTGLGSVTLKAEQAGNEDFLPLSEGWTFTVIPPQIEVRLAGDQVELHWSTGLTGFNLQIAESLASGSQWHDVTTSPIEVNGEASLRLDQSAPQSYFRLFKP